MAYSYEQILRAQYQRIAEDQAQVGAELEAARITEDAYGVTAAADKILALDQQRSALDARAQSFVASQQQPQGNKYGLSRDEIEIASGIAGSDPRMSQDERERVYAEQKHKLRYMRQTGQYRDDQGTVRR